MAEVTRERHGELLRALFKILLEQPDGLQARDALAKLEQSIELSEFEKSSYPSNPNVQRFDKIVRFATITTVKANWLSKKKGQWSVTDEGKQTYHKFQDP